MPTKKSLPTLLLPLALLCAAPAVAQHGAAEPATAEPLRLGSPVIAGHAAGDPGEDAPEATGPESGFAVADSSLAAAWGRWFEALQGTVTERTAAGHAESAPLYPLGRAAPDAEPTGQPYRHLAIAKAVTQLEASPAGRAAGSHAAEAGGAGSHAEGGHESEGPGESGGEAPGESQVEARAATAAGSPLLALANARNYLNLSEYGKALEWYGRAAAQDADGNFRRETGRETLAAAICARDTAAAGRAVANIMAISDPVGREDEIVLAFRWLLNRGDRASLEWLVQRTESPDAAVDARVAFWRAYALSSLERRDEALAQLRALLCLGGEGRTLSERERGWVLTATADLLLLQGAAAEAGALYDRLAGSELPSLRQWGRLQAAGLAFVGHRYADASAGYREICQADRNGPWAAHACAMADIATQLERLLSGGEHHGADAEPRQ